MTLRLPDQWYGDSMLRPWVRGTMESFEEAFFRGLKGITSHNVGGEISDLNALSKMLRKFDSIIYSGHAPVGETWTRTGVPDMCPADRFGRDEVVQKMLI